MIRYIKEDEVKELLTMHKAVELVELALRERTEGRAIDVPRVRTRTGAGILHIMQAAAPVLKLVGYKAYYGRTSHVHLFDADSGKPLAIIESGYLGLVRTGAASGVATRYLARKDASVVAMLGAGRQAIGQLEAVCAVRKVREVRVYSRTAERANAFCAQLADKVGVPMNVVASAAEAVRGADVINVITKAASPVLQGAWLEPGQHVNAAGSNSLARREIDEAAVQRCAPVVVDSRATARNECGDLLPLVETGFLDWEGLAELGEVVVGRVPGRTSQAAITLFESHGMAVEDLYTANYVLEVARQTNVGTDLPIGD